MARFQLPRLSSNLRAYFSHFGRSIILVVSILIVVGLAAATYFYGQRKQGEDGPKTESAPSSSQEAPTQSAPDSQSNTTSSNPSPSPSPSSSSDSSTSPAPSTLINTGAEDWTLPVIIALCVLATLYQRSRKELSEALQTV